MTDSPAAPLGERPRRRRRLLGDMLRDVGIITQSQLDQVLAQQKKERGSRVGRLLIDLGYATEVQICEAVAEQLQIPAADLVAVDVPNEVLSLVPKELADKHACLPWFVEGRELYLIMADPTNVVAADAIAFHTGLRVKPVVAPESEILLALQRFYAAEESSLAQLEGVDLAEQLSVVADSPEVESESEDVEKAAQAVPLVKLVNAVLADVIRAGASDVHIEDRHPDPRPGPGEDRPGGAGLRA